MDGLEEHFHASLHDAGDYEGMGIWKRRRRPTRHDDYLCDTCGKLRIDGCGHPRRRRENPATVGQERAS